MNNLSPRSIHSVQLSYAISGLLLLLVFMFSAQHRAAAATETSIDDDWSSIVQQAAGQTVYFNAWGGSDRINAYLDWVADELKTQHNVTLKHVKIGDIAEVVSQLEAAKLVGRNSDGNVDLMWVNGENFAAMKTNQLMWGAFAHALPNARYLKDSESLTTDFSVAVDGLESPWGGAQLVFIYDTALLTKPPKSARQLAEFVKKGGRFAYPAPPAFHGTTMIKQLLIELTDNVDALSKPASEADFEAVTAPLWQYLEELHPLLWGKGKSWPASGEATRQMLDDSELDLALSFNPNEASAAVQGGQLPDSVRTFVFDQGTIGNTHFVTVPYNATAKAGAMVVADFLISPQAQARKADPQYWGDPTVLDINTLEAAERALFDAVDLGKWALPLGTGSTLAEPHASWAVALEEAWLARFGQ